uniref:Uncharacterized protein n=1 Tax=Trichogramma kaykai TaxID=54128 RepID=A0ABD2WY42_9HYME
MSSPFDDFFVFLHSFVNVGDFLKELKSIRESVNWEVEAERDALYDRVQFLIRNWKGPLPNLRDIFRTVEIDWLLTEDVKNKNDNIYGGYPLIQFAARTGYKDEPEIDENGKPLLRRTTPIHNAHAMLRGSFTIIRELFKIYDRFDVNYTDEFGYTHFHVVCRHGCCELVEKFLEAGQDPNLVVTKTGNSPLHLAVTHVDEDTVRVLLKNGADPNLANKDGLTPLHFICNTDEDEIFAELFFKISNQVGRPVQVDARDKLGRTPLQLAVSTFLPRVIDVLLDRGADVTSFVYPTESYFGVSWIIEEDRCDDFIIRLAFDALAILERIEKRGYELDQGGALTITKYFAKYGMFKMSADLDRCWYDDEQFAIQAKKLEVSPSLSFYDLVRLRPEKANKLFTREFDQYYDFVNEEGYWKNLSKECMEAFDAHMGEVLMRAFYRRLALRSFLEMTHYQLPILCCEIIIEKLMNKDLYCIFLAAADQSL